MDEIPESMKDELGRWNNGNGIDPESWVGCEGNFRLAVGYSTVFWPTFEAVGKYILMEGCSASQIAGFEQSDAATPRSVEAVLNHLHLEDLQHRHCEDISPDKLLFLGQVLIEIYQAKLAWQFPDRPCTVKLIVPDDPEDYNGYQITFWQQAFEP